MSGCFSANAASTARTSFVESGFICMKLNQEEALLTRHFPEAYPEYKSRTKALITFVW